MKSTIRHQLRIKRRAMGCADHEQRSKLAAAAIKRMASFKAGARIAIYLPFDAETHTDALILAGRRRNVRLYVPVVGDLRHRRLKFYPLFGPTRPGTFGIAEPRRVGLPLAPRWFNLVVVPLVGVDAQGRRLGMGGGFYDRALHFRRGRLHWKGPRLVGFGFDCQRVTEIHADPWDVRLDSLATESGLEHFPKGMQ